MITSKAGFEGVKDISTALYTGMMQSDAAILCKGDSPHPQLPGGLVHAAHLVERKATAAAQHAAGGVDPAGQLKVAQRVCMLLLLYQDLAQAIPAGAHNTSAGAHMGYTV